jgi:hypothetical protein
MPGDEPEVPMKGLVFSILMLLLVASPAGTEAEVQPPPPPSDASSGGEREGLEEFVPSERVPADTAVSFPWDI